MIENTALPKGFSLDKNRISTTYNLLYSQYTHDSMVGQLRSLGTKRDSDFAPTKLVVAGDRFEPRIMVLRCI